MRVRRRRVGATLAGHLLCCLVLFLPWGLQAQNLGEAFVLSALGDPVEVEIPVQDWAGLDPESLEPGLASRAQYEGFGLDWLPALDALRFNLVGPLSDGSLRLLVSSAEPVEEPYLELLLSLRWPGGSLLREYVLLFDPPTSAVAGGQARPATAPRAPQAGGRRVYQVHEGEAFWSIAQQFLVAGEAGSLHQMLLALYDLNPGAFVNDNISLLRADALLQIPTAADLRRIDASTAEARFDALWAAGIAALRPPPAFAELAPVAPRSQGGSAAAAQAPEPRAPGRETGRVSEPGNGWLLPANTPVVMPLGAEASPQEQEGALLSIRQRTLDALSRSPRLGTLALAGQDDPGLQRLTLRASILLSALGRQAERRERLQAAVAESRAEMDRLLQLTLQTRAALEVALAEAERRKALAWKPWLALALLGGILLGLLAIPWLCFQFGKSEVRSWEPTPECGRINALKQ